MRQTNRKSPGLFVPLFLFWLCKRFLAQYSVLLIEKRSNRLFQRGLELTTKRSRGSIRRQFFLLWNYDEKKSCTKGRHAPSCSSFHLNAARMRCAPVQFARVLGCRLCCGFGCAPLIGPLAGKWWKSDAGTLRKEVPASLFLAAVG